MAFSEARKKDMADRIRTTLAVNATEEASRRLQVMKDLYGDLPLWARFVMRCIGCKKVVIFMDVIPVAAVRGKLSSMTCKGCGAVQPMVENMTKYATSVVFSIAEDIENHMKEPSKSSA